MESFLSQSQFESNNFLMVWGILFLVLLIIYSENPSPPQFLNY